MGNLSDFLNPLPIEAEKDVYVSNRFVCHDKDGKIMVDADGAPVLKPFKVRALTQEENDALVKASTHKVRVNGKYEDKLDTTELSRRLVVAATVDPDFRSTELCEKLGTLNPLEVPGKMLLSGEFSKLSDAILEISGFASNDTAIADEAKN